MNSEWLRCVFMNTSYESAKRGAGKGLALVTLLALAACSRGESGPDATITDGPEPSPSTSCMPLVKRIGSMLLTSSQAEQLKAGERPTDADFGALTKGTGYGEEDVDMFRIIMRQGTLNEETANEVAKTVDEIVAPDKRQNSIVMIVPTSAPEGTAGVEPGEILLEAGVPDGCRTVTVEPDQTVVAT